jgi:hypothetical protein
MTPLAVGSPGRAPRSRVVGVRPVLGLAAMLLLSLAGCGFLRSSPSYALRITYQAVPVDGRTPTADEMDTIRTIVESRLNTTGIAELRVSVEPPDRLVV